MSTSYVPRGNSSMRFRLACKNGPRFTAGCRTWVFRRGAFNPTLNTKHAKTRREQRWLNRSTFTFGVCSDFHAFRKTSRIRRVSEILRLTPPPSRAIAFSHSHFLHFHFFRFSFFQFCKIDAHGGVQGRPPDKKTCKKTWIDNRRLLFLHISCGLYALSSTENVDSKEENRVHSHAHPARSLCTPRAHPAHNLKKTAQEINWKTSFVYIPVCHCKSCALFSWKTCVIPFFRVCGVILLYTCKRGQKGLHNRFFSIIEKFWMGLQGDFMGFVIPL